MHNMNELPIPPKEISEKILPLRVAAYCRIAAAQQGDDTILQFQIDQCLESINGNPDWELAGVYADNGFAAAHGIQRPDFNRMIEDCKAGKIDLIYAKSICRFTRSVQDIIRYTDLLQSMGIDTIFEKEGIDTGNPNSERFLAFDDLGR